MSAADLAHPEWLVPVAGAVAIGWLGATLGFAGARRRWRRLLPALPAPGPRRAASDAALCLALAAVGAAVLGPRWAERRVPVASGGSDVVILFDTSRSMDAEDTPPSRIARARRTAVELLDRLEPGSRAALAAFAGAGAVLTPLTPDTAALGEWVEAIDADLVRPGGSDLSAGLAAARTVFESGSERPRVVVVLSDGEVRPAVGSSDAGALEGAGIRAIAVAFGDPRGSTLPDHGVPLRDAHGEIVVSRRTDAPLRALADGTGGRLLVADAWGAVDPATLAAEVERDTRRAAAGDGPPTWRTVRSAAVAPFAGLAFVLLALEAWTAARTGIRAPARRRGRERAASPPRAETGPGASARARRRASAAVLLALAGLGADRADDPAARAAALETRALARPLDAAELVELGIARFEAGRAVEADHAFREAAVSAADPGIAALAHHALGVLAIERGDLERARDHFFDAVALDPERRRSRFNLEWVLRALATRPPEGRPAPDDAGSERDEPESEGPPETPPPPIEAESLPGDSPETASAEPEPAAAPEPTPADTTADRGTQPSDAAGAPPPPQALDPDEQARWLARVADDPARALRAAAADPAQRHETSPRGPAW